MQIIDNKALLLNVRNPQRITTVIPKSKDLGDGRVLVNWGLDEAQVLKNLKIKSVPSPINRDYDWPGRYKPFDHQRETASFLTLHRKAFCLSEAGTGKTGSVIWAADYLMKKGKINRVLIVCPLSIMDSAWQSDLFNFAMHRTVDIAHGSREKRIKTINSGAEFVIINFDGIEIVEEEIRNGGFDLVVVDECSHYSNPQTTRWKVLNRILRHDSWLWMLTGTPAAQSPVQAYGLAKLVSPQNVPKFAGTFKEMVMYKVGQFKWMPRPNAEKIVHNVLQPAIRYTKAECLDLPEMLYTTREVELTPQQKKYYDILKKQSVINTAGEQITAINAAVGLNKMLQLSCGSIYSDTGETVHFDVKNRYKVLKEAIDESTNKILIFVPFRHTIELLHQKLTGDGYTAEIINGEVPVTRRSAIFKQFQTEKDPRILIIQPQAAAHGVTLTAADTVIWWGPTSSLEIYEQANARAHRAGQRHPVTVIRLQGSPAEKHVYKMLDNRSDNHTKLVELYKNLLE